MKSLIFDLITSSFSVFNNPLNNYICMGILGMIAFKISYYIVGMLNLRGELGSIVHWTIRLIAFILLWIMCIVVIKTVIFIINNWINVLIILILTVVFILIKKYADCHSKSFLNRKLF